MRQPSLLRLGPHGHREPPEPTPEDAGQGLGGYSLYRTDTGRLSPELIASTGGQ
jgi:hypothetical protein